MLTINLNYFKINIVLPLTILFVVFGCSGIKNSVQMVTKDFEFISGNKTLSGIIDQPVNGKAQALIVFVHGTGNTNIRKENRYHDLRRRFVELGITCVTWDKPGQGRSEGVYNYNQPLEEIAKGVLDAITWLRAQEVPGSESIGIWGTSQGGWVVPIALSQEPSIKFWISVSGVPAEDNKYYLMKSNLPLEGRTQQETERLMEEWRRGKKIFIQGGDYEEYLSATETLRKDPAVFDFAGDLTGSKEEYKTEQEAYMKMKDQFEFDKETFSLMRVRNFDKMLEGLDIDVLALFGEKDTNVDWRKARALYESTIGQNPNASLTMHNFPNCNHSMSISETGSVREVEGTPLGVGIKCEGYYEAQIEWLREYVISK